MTQDAGQHHKGAADQSQTGHHEAAYRTLLLLLAHPLDEDGDIHQVDGDDGQLGGVEHEGSLGAPDSGQVGQVEVHKPDSGHQKGNYRGVVGHVGGLVHLGEHLGLGAAVTGAQRVHAAAAAQHQTVQGAHAGDGDKQVEDVAQHRAKHVVKGYVGAGIHQILGAGTAGHAHEVEDIDSDDDQTAQNQSLGQVLLGVLDLGVDRGGDDPTLVSKGGGAHGGKQGVGGQVSSRNHGGGQILLQHAVVQAVDDTDDTHEQQGDQLDDGCAGLELTGQLGGQGVEHVGTAHEQGGQSHALRADHAAALLHRNGHGEAGVDGGDEHQGVAGRQPSQGRGHAGEVDGGGEPAHIIGVAGAYRGFGVVYDAVDPLVLLPHKGEGQQAGQHDSAADDPGDDAQGGVTTGFLQDGLRLEEDARADDDAYHHADGGKQTILAFQFLFHVFSSFLSFVYLWLIFR